MEYNQGTKNDLKKIIGLALKSWSQFQSALTPENWSKLHASLSDETTFAELLKKSECFTCNDSEGKIIGVAFLVSRGNPTEIFNGEWSYIRYLTVDQDFAGQGIGRKLTLLCIEAARKNGEKIIALHTSEMMNKARHIYETLGFNILREIDSRQGKRYWLYTLDLI